ncbi:MAG: NAD-dependent epimerase/dehydratase family protein [Elusimicrobiota bacterium]
MTGFWDGKKVLVTGGAGFIGGHLVELLVHRGARVRVPQEPGKDLSLPRELRPSVELLSGDLLDPGFCRKAARGQEVVMDLAAVVGGIHYNIARPASIFRDNLRLFMNVLEAARLEGAERFLVTSSASVYPRRCSQPTPEDEGFAGVPEPTTEGYGWAKRMAEFLGAAYRKEYGMRVGIARPQNAYGPRCNFDPKRSHVIPALIRRVVEGEAPLRVWGDGSQSLTFLYVTDLVRGLLAVAERHAEADPINLGSAESIRIRDLVKLICEAAGAEPEIVFDTSAPTGQPRRQCDTRKAEEVLGFRPEVPLREGLRRTVEWYRQNKRTWA